MNNIRSTLATVWRIAAPYFRSEDKWAGRGLLAAVIAIELALVAIDVLLNQWNNRFYNALQERNWDIFVYRDRLFLRAGRHLHRARRLPALSQSMAADPLAALDDHALSRRMAASAPTIIACSCRATPPTTPTSASPTTSSCSSSARWTSGVGLLNSVVTLASFVVILWGLSNAAPLHLFGRDIRDPRLSGLGRADLCGVRHHPDALDRLAAGRHRFPAAALRGGFPLQPGAGAGKLRADRAVARRERRARAPAGPLRPRGRKLARHHEPDQEADGVHRELCAGRGDLSLHPGGAGLFRQQDPARRHDADRIRLFAACRARCRSSSPSTASWRTGARWSPASTDSRRRSRGHASLQPAATGFTSSRRRAAARSTSRGCLLRLPNGTPLVTAERIQLAQGRAHADHRPVGLRQIDAVPRHRRHLAVRQRHDHHSGEGNIDDAAAAAVLPDRIAARGDRLSRRGRAPSPTVQISSALEQVGLPKLASQPGRRRRTGTGRCRSASSSGWGSRARCCMRRNTCSSTKPPLRSTSLRRRRCIACSRRNCRQPPSSRSATARRSRPSTSAMSALVRDGDRFALQDGGESVKAM